MGDGAGIIIIWGNLPLQTSVEETKTTLNFELEDLESVGTMAQQS
jgi:hypothetical protein